MTPEQAISFVAFSSAAAATPGPSNALLTATAANVGALRGVPALLGVAVGMGLLMFVVTLGLGSVILAEPLMLGAVRAVGAAFLFWLAWRIATSGRGGDVTDSRSVGLLGMAAFQWVNPKSWLVCASAAGTFLDRGGGSALAQSAAFGLTFALGSLPSCFPWLAFGALMQRFLRSDRAARIFNGVMGALLAASVVLFFV